MEIKMFHIRIQIEASGNIIIVVNKDMKIIMATKGLMIHKRIRPQNYLILREIPFV